MLCFLNNLYVSLNVNMKKTKFKLILNSNSYRIYTDNGIEYCRFKKKYYPLNEIENVINSYKIGGGGKLKQQQPSNPKELAENIIKLLNENEIPTIYAYYFYFKNKNTQDTEKIIKEIEKDILKDPSKYKKKYIHICDAVNRLMIYLTTTATKIKADNYTDETLCDEYSKYFDTLVFTNEVLDRIDTDTDAARKSLTEKYIRALYKELPTVFENVKDKSKLTNLLKTQGGDNNYKTAIDNIFNYTESSDESDILYDSDISEESIISIRSDYSEDLITPLLTPQT